MNRKLEESFEQSLGESRNQIKELNRQVIEVQKKVDIVQQSGFQISKKLLIQSDQIDDKANKTETENLSKQMKLISDTIKLNFQQLADKEAMAEMCKRIEFLEKNQKNFVEKISYARENDK